MGWQSSVRAGRPAEGRSTYREGGGGSRLISLRRIVSYRGEGADTTEATDVALWQVFEDYVVGRAVEAALETAADAEAGAAQEPSSGDDL